MFEWDNGVEYERYVLSNLEMLVRQYLCSDCIRFGTSSQVIESSGTFEVRQLGMYSSKQVFFN